MLIATERPVGFRNEARAGRDTDEDAAGVAPGLTEFAAPTIATVIEAHAATHPNRPAIIMSMGRQLTYGALASIITSFGTDLRVHGIRRSDRIAIVLPDGPELAVVVAATACHAVAVPINPKMTTTEFGDLFTMLRVDVLLVSDQFDSPARTVATSCGVRVLSITSQAHGVVRIISDGTVTCDRDSLGTGANPNAPALILRTSATTGKPKFVPITHGNLLTTAGRRRHWYDLRTEDRALCATPLYYSQGLKDGLFTPLLLGQSSACPDRTTSDDLLHWIVTLRPTYFSAGPTLLLNLLERALARRGEPLNHSLRFIRSGTATLPAFVRQGLEKQLGVPVLEGYGLSETGTLAANGVAPERRKAGTVGKAWPDDVAIRAEDGRLLPPGMVGEIVARGPSVSPGYLYNDEANRMAFVDGWFRTGDLGSIDAEGFLTVIGRIKEFISRGGEKISPYEVECALLSHPCVREAAAFAIPHPRLGEDVAAAIVLFHGAKTTAADVRAFLVGHLAPFKIPQHVFIMPELPKGPTGKILRAQLSKTAAQRVDDIVPPSLPLHAQILEIWQRLLGRTDIGIDHDFFAVGGDSLLATDMVCDIEVATGQPLMPSALRTHYTIRALAEAVLRTAPATTKLVTWAKHGRGTPMFFCHGDYTGRGAYALELARQLKGDQPVILLHPIIDPDPTLTIEEMAKAYVPQVLAAQPTGVFRLGGHCNGGLLAWEIARQLGRMGRDVAFVVLVDTLSLNARLRARLLARLVKLISRVVPKRFGTRLRRDGMRAVSTRLNWHRSLNGAYSRAISNYLPSRLRSRVVCVICEESRCKKEFSAEPWSRLATEVHCKAVAGTHSGCITAHVEDIAKILDEVLSMDSADPLPLNIAVLPSTSDQPETSVPATRALASVIEQRD